MELYSYITNKKIHIFFAVILYLLFSIITFHTFRLDAHASETKNDDVVVCIDAGHGGENLGAEWQGYTEKEMTLIVANSMKDELEKYEGVKVYLTRDADVDMGLEERVTFAKEVNADFFFCLHFNMSAEHDMYGAECWISAFDKNYARGSDFSKIEMNMLTDLGLYDRGIKTRLNGKGTNYYGVLRVADELQIPGVIIEHCHLDNYKDEPFYDNDKWLKDYGILDATAVAKYYGLKSSVLGNDYSDFEYDKTPIPEKRMDPDETEPIIEMLTIGEPYNKVFVDGQSTDYADIKEAGPGSCFHSFVDVEMRSYDPECRMLYYCVSLDGGKSWSERYEWPEYGSDEIIFTIEIPYNTKNDIQIRTFNLYDLYTDSSITSVTSLDSPEFIDYDSWLANEKNREQEFKEATNSYTDVNRYDNEENKVKGDADYVYFVMVAGLVLVLLIIIAIGITIIIHGRR